MQFPPTSLTAIFDKLSGSDTVFHAGPGASRSLIEAYRRSDADLVICEPDPDAADELRAALPSTARTPLIQAAVKRGGGQAQLHRFNIALLNTIGDAAKVSGFHPSVRVRDTRTVETIDPADLIKRAPRAGRGNDVLVVYGFDIAADVLTGLSESALLTRFGEIIVRFSADGPGGQALRSQLDALGFDLSCQLEEAPKGAPVACFRRNRLAGELERLGVTVSTLEEENQALWADQSKLEADRDELRAKLDESSAASGALESALEAARAQLKDVQADHEQVKARAKELEKSRKSLTKGAETARTERNEAAAAIKAAQGAQAEAEERADAAEAEIKTLKAAREEDAAAIEAARKAESEAKERAEAEIETLRAQSTEDAAAVETAKGAQAEAEERAEAAESEIETLKAQRNEDAAAVETARRAEIDSKQRVDAAEGARAEVETQLGEARSHVEGLSRSQAELQARCEELESRAQAAEARVAALEEVETQLKERNRSLQAMTNQSGATIAELEQKRSALVVRRSEAEARVRELEEEIGALRSRAEAADTLKQELAALKVETGPRIETLREELLSTRASRDEVTSRLDLALRLQSALQEDLKDLQARHGALVNNKDQQDRLVRRLTDKLILASENFRRLHDERAASKEVEAKLTARAEAVDE